MERGKSAKENYESERVIMAILWTFGSFVVFVDQETLNMFAIVVQVHKHCLQSLGDAGKSGREVVFQTLSRHDDVTEQAPQELGRVVTDVR